MPNPRPRAARLGEAIGDVRSAKATVRSMARKRKAHVAKPRGAQVAPASPPMPVHYVHQWQADGTVLSRPVETIAPDRIGTPEAAKMLRLHPRTVSRACDMGEFRTALKTGGFERSRWKIERSEVVAMAKVSKDKG